MTCPKCHATSGNDWSQCKDACPMKVSPKYLDLRARATAGQFFDWLLFQCFSMTWQEYKFLHDLRGGTMTLYEDEE